MSHILRLTLLVGLGLVWSTGALAD